VGTAFESWAIVLENICPGAMVDVNTPNLGNLAGKLDYIVDGLEIDGFEIFVSFEHWFLLWGFVRSPYNY
jgi:hypothetical protein